MVKEVVSMLASQKQISHRSTQPCRWRGWPTLLLTLLLVAVSLVGATNLQAQAAPTIVSDLADYPPGATVTLTGQNWQPGESVHIFVNDDVGQTWSHNSSPDPVADGNGSFTYSFQLPNWFVADYSVTATGAASGIARTTF